MAKNKVDGAVGNIELDGRREGGGGVGGQHRQWGGQKQHVSLSTGSSGDANGVAADGGG